MPFVCITEQPLMKGYIAIVLLASIPSSTKQSNACLGTPKLFLRMLTQATEYTSTTHSTQRRGALKTRDSTASLGSIIILSLGSIIIWHGWVKTFLRSFLHSRHLDVVSLFKQRHRFFNCKHTPYRVFQTLTGFEGFTSTCWAVITPQKL